MKFNDYAAVAQNSTDARNFLQLEVKKLYLQFHIQDLYSRVDPAALWHALLKHRFVPTTAKEDESTNGTSAASSASPPPSLDELRIDYKGFRAVAFEFMFGNTLPDMDEPTKKRLFFEHPFLSPEAFLEFEQDPTDGTISAVPLYAYVAKRMLLFRMRVELELCACVPPSVNSSSHPGGMSPCEGPKFAPSATSPMSNGISPEDLETFIAQLVPNLRLVRDMPPWMLPYYLCHASRKFFFLLDPRGLGALSIDAIMKSDVFSELLRVYECDVQDATIEYPVGTRVEVPKARFVDVALHPDCTTKVDAAAPEDTEEELIEGEVLSFENEGRQLSDMYTLRVVSSATGGDAVVVRVPRSQCYWCPATSHSLSSDMLALDNWFSLPLMHRVYSHFTQLDVDGDGVLTMKEFQRYSNSSYTPLAVHRVFDCYVPSSQDGPAATMDYKGYLNFVVATEHPHTSASARFLWRLLDIEDTHSFISLSALRCFTKEVSAMLVSSGLMTASNHISGQSILSEVVDMINPAWHEHVTLKDVEACKQHATVLLILLNYRSFYAYDCREQSAAASTEEFV